MPVYEQSAEEATDFVGIRQFWKQNKKEVAWIIAWVAAIIVGYIFVHVHTFTQRQVIPIGLVGELYSRSVECLALPLIVFSVATTLSKMENRHSLQLFFSISTFSLMSLLVASAIGIIIAMILRPGKDAQENPIPEMRVELQDLILDLIRMQRMLSNADVKFAAKDFTQAQKMSRIVIGRFIGDVIPYRQDTDIITENVVSSCVYSHDTKLIKPHKSEDNNTGHVIPRIEWDFKSNPRALGTNYKGLIAASSVAGLCLAYKNRRQRFVYLLEKFAMLMETCVRPFVYFIMYNMLKLCCGRSATTADWLKVMIGIAVEFINLYSDFYLNFCAKFNINIFPAYMTNGIHHESLAPLGIFFSQLNTILQLNVEQIYEARSLLITTFLAGIVVVFGFYPIVYLFVLKEFPTKMIGVTILMICLASSTRSSLVTLPISMVLLKDNYELLGVTSKFTLPVCCFLHMPGSATCLGILCIFVTQTSGDISLHSLTILEMIFIILCGTITMKPIFGYDFSAWIHITAVLLKLPVEYGGDYQNAADLMDEIATAVNVVADMYVAIIVDKLMAKRLALDKIAPEYN